MVLIETVEQKVIWLTPEQVADVLKMTPRGVHYLRRRGILHPLRLGMHVYYLEAEVKRVHREGWRGRHWSHVLEPQALRFRKDDRRMFYMRDLRARKRAAG